MSSSQLLSVLCCVVVFPPSGLTASIAAGLSSPLESFIVTSEGIPFTHSLARSLSLSFSAANFLWLFHCLFFPGKTGIEHGARTNQFSRRDKRAPKKREWGIHVGSFLAGVALHSVEVAPIGRNPPSVRPHHLSSASVNRSGPFDKNDSIRRKTSIRPIQEEESFGGGASTTLCDDDCTICNGMCSAD